MWAAKLTARHPNLVALELSSFKCGHEASIYSVVESIIEKSGTPYFSFKDIDENKPSGSINPMSRTDWRRHFGPAFRQLRDAKRTYDPRNVLTPGYAVFGQPRWHSAR